MRLGSLCTGIGGLDLAVERFFGAGLAWCAEIDPAASRVLAARFPGVPNIGNFVGQNPEPVDVLCGGFPCQPVSLAGKRAGTHDDRWLFDDICDLVGRMEPRPRWLVFENVRGLLSANGGDAMARVVHGLARLGYMGSWRVVRASDVGAPHRRERVFIVAADADVSGGEACDGRPWAGELGRLQSVVRGDEASADAEDGRLARALPAGSSRRQGVLLAGHWPAAPDTDGAARPGERRQRAGEALHEPGTVERSGRCNRVDFGPFAPAVERWERLLGRAAPAPVDDRRRLNPAFVEWMMGFPAGWVTDVLNRRTDALRCLGNAVVPQQAMHALSLLVPDTWSAGAQLAPHGTPDTTARRDAGADVLPRTSHKAMSLGEARDVLAEHVESRYDAVAVVEGDAVVAPFGGDGCDGRDALAVVGHVLGDLGHALIQPQTVHRVNHKQE